MGHKDAEILLLDCDPRERTGDALETILKSRLPATLWREVIVDTGEIQFDWERLDGASGPKSLLVFLILPRQELHQRGRLIQSIKKQHSEAAIIVVINDCGPMETLELLQMGASDFVTPPLRAADIVPRALRLLEQLRSREALVDTLKEKVGLKQLIGKTANFLAEIKKIPLIARCDNRVLIAGETGTGKEMCARAIHYLSPRVGKPFVPVNCGAIPIELVENELFGHERGAFTGANTARPGLIEEAEGGTLFLDEIDCLPLMAQVKLLRFLQEKEYRRLGSSRVRHADVRVITATNKTLEEAVQNGSLRQDLYYRLNVVSIVLPPLRERREDIPFLVYHFLAKYASEFHEEVKTLTAEAIQKLAFYGWPGNVRELEHTVERAVMFCKGPRIGEEDIVLPGQTRWCSESFQQAKAKIVRQFERDYIQRLLLSHDGNISKAAQAARKNRRAFWELIRKHHIDVHNFKPRTS
jgi:two-component system, NtrC family, response regulator GlrR